jgi:predicted DNA-binding mobile mystery protein A
MRPEDRAMARRQIDKRLNLLPKIDVLVRPPRGWIKAIREALGMTTAQMGKRIGVSQPRVVAIEKAEKTGSITIDTLERAARALDCQLVYTLVPRKPLEEMIIERATRLAKRRLNSTGHSMSLEAQDLAASDYQAQLEQLIQRLMSKAGSEIWDEEA